MVSNSSRSNLYYDKKLKAKILENFDISDVKEIEKLIYKFLADGFYQQDPKHHESIDTKLKKVKLANETLKVWKDIRSSGGTVDDLERLVNHGEIPQLQNDYEESTPEETKKLEFKTFGQTVTHKPKKILQDDGTLRCMRCNKTIEMRAFDFEQLDDYRKHVETNHGKLFESERKELMGIYPN